MKLLYVLLGGFSAFGLFNTWSQLVKVWAYNNIQLIQSQKFCYWLSVAFGLGFIVFVAFIVGMWAMMEHKNRKTEVA